MATYTFKAVPAWGSVGQFARIGTKKSTTFPCTLPGGGDATVVQGGTTKVGYLESDANGLIPDWTTTDIPSVDIDFGVAVLRVNSEDAITSGASSAAAAATSAADAATSATSAASSADDAASSATDAANDAAGRTLTGTGVASTDTAALGSELSSAATAKLSLHLRGSFALNATVTVPADAHLDMGTSVLTSTLTTSPVFAVTGANATIQGGEIVSPATFDGTNVQPTTAVIHVTGSGATVRDVTLTNVPKVGIYADDVDDLIATGNRIAGNYPAGSWTGTETGHFGIAVNPGTSGRSGRTVISGNLIRSCVQGVFFGNYGTAATGALGGTVTGNVFDGCHNHGVYNAGGVDGCTVSGNSFARCSLPIALTGTAHTVSGNTLVTMGTGNNLDLVGISLREAVDCTVTGNTIKGDAPASSVIIDIANFTGTSVRGNVVSNNTIDVTGGTSTGIRVGRPPQTTDCSDNVVANNTIRSVGNAGVGLITVNTATSGTGNKVTGNSLVVKGETHGIYVNLVSHSTVQGNSVRFEFDAPSAKILGAILLSATSYCTASHNDIYNLAAYGTNVALRGVWETGAASKNRVIQNGYHGDLTKLTSFTPIVLITNSDAYLDERGIGSPSGAFFGAPGSRWSREDGGASTSLYVKETANTSATWAAK